MALLYKEKVSDDQVQDTGDQAFLLHLKKSRYLFIIMSLMNIK